MRRPVAMTTEHFGDLEVVVVVCDDGTVWGNSGADWYEWAQPIPGTAGFEEAEEQRLNDEAWDADDELASEAAK